MKSKQKMRDAREAGGRRCGAKNAEHHHPLDPLFDDFRRRTDDLQKAIRRIYPGVETTIALSTQGPKRAARDFNPLLLARDVTIKRYRHLPDRRICGNLDSELEWGRAATVGLPLPWTEKPGIQTFVQAYDDPDFRPLVQKMISKAKKRLFHLP